jgi:hypothetical protein
MPKPIDPLLQVGARPAVRTANRAEAGRQLAELDVKLAEYLPKEELDALVSITNGIFGVLEQATPAEPEESPVTGRAASTPRQVAAAHRANLLRSFALRRRVLQDTLTAKEVTELLGAASRQTAHDRVRAGTLLAIRDGGRLHFPVWQFDAEGPDGVLEGLPQVIAELAERTQLGQILWFMTAKRQLQGRTPLELLRAGELDAVLAEARASRAR